MHNCLSENIKRLFRMDTLIASLEGVELSEFMCKKHRWTHNVWRTYSAQYKEYLLADEKEFSPVRKPKLLYKENDLIAVISGEYTISEILNILQVLFVEKNVEILFREEKYLMIRAYYSEDMQKPYIIKYTVKAPELSIIGWGELETSANQLIN